MQIITGSNNATPSACRTQAPPEPGGTLGALRGQAAEVSIDGITRGLVSLYNPTVITRTFDYGGLGVGPHVLQVRAVNGVATPYAPLRGQAVDAFLTPSFYPTATQRTVITYAYDPLYRVTRSQSTGELAYIYEYTYDEVGNRTTQTATITSTQVTNYVYDAANRLTSVDGQAYTWDDNPTPLRCGDFAVIWSAMAKRRIPTIRRIAW